MKNICARPQKLVCFGSREIRVESCKSESRIMQLKVKACLSSVKLVIHCLTRSSSSLSELVINDLRDRVWQNKLFK